MCIQEKLRKKKRIKAIKSKNRFVTKEVEVAAVKKNWQSFVTKVRIFCTPSLVREWMFTIHLEHVFFVLSGRKEEHQRIDEKQHVCIACRSGWKGERG